MWISGLLLLLLFRHCVVADNDPVMDAIGELQRRMMRLSHDMATIMTDVKTFKWQNERHQKLSEELSNDMTEVKTMVEKIHTHQVEGHIRVDCDDDGGIGTVYVKQHVIIVPCDDNGWLVLMRRVNGNYDFPNRKWNDYKHGFGNMTESFWLGLESMHRLTELRPGKLRVELEDWEGGTAWAQYEDFRIEAEDTGYRLLVDDFSGPAGNSLSKNNGMKFSTVDQDNDEHPSNACASLSYNGGWWYNRCGHSKLTAQYVNKAEIEAWHGIVWYHWKGSSYSLKAVSMKMLPGSI